MTSRVTLFLFLLMARTAIQAQSRTTRVSGPAPPVNLAPSCLPGKALEGTWQGRPAQSQLIALAPDGSIIDPDFSWTDMPYWDLDGQISFSADGTFELPNGRTQGTWELTNIRRTVDHSNPEVATCTYYLADLLLNGETYRIFWKTPDKIDLQCFRSGRSLTQRLIRQP